MLSAFPASNSTGLPFPFLQGGFTTSWQHQDIIFDQYPLEEPLLFPNKNNEQVFSSSSGSYVENELYESIRTGSVIDKGKLKASFHLSQGESSFPNGDMNELLMSNSSGSEPNEGTHHNGSIIDERKRNRMISNRDSARRSRKKKQKLLEDLTKQVKQYKCLNHELTSRLHSITHVCQLLERENAMLESESGFLQQRLWVMRQVLIAHDIEQMQYNHLIDVTNGLNIFNQNSHLLNL